MRYHHMYRHISKNNFGDSPKKQRQRRSSIWYGYDDGKQGSCANAGILDLGSWKLDIAYCMG